MVAQTVLAKSKVLAVPHLRCEWVRTCAGDWSNGQMRTGGGQPNGLPLENTHTALAL